MPQLPVTAETLGMLDGGAAKAIIDAAIREALFDLDDRGFQDGKPRRVEIILTFDLLDNGQVGTRVEAIAKAPRRRTAATIGAFRRENEGVRLVFAQGAPEDPHQTTIDDLTRE